MKQNNKRIIGITGGIGTGKSTVTDLLKKQFNIKVIDVDKIAREITKKGSKVLAEITKHFGDVLLNTGELDRKRLSDIVFKNPKDLEDLNEITHKYISDKIYEMINEFQNQEAIIIDTAIPFTHGFIDIVTEIWTVVSDIEVRIDRLIMSRGLTREEAILRINSQMSEKDYCKIADNIIYNNGDIEYLRNQVIGIYLARE